MSATKASKPATLRPRFVPLPAETWGQRFRRARPEGLDLRAAAATLSQVAWPVSYDTPHRLESAKEKPKNRRTQLWAVLFLLSYGVDPEEFGLDLDVIPDLDGLVERVLFSNLPENLRPANTDIARHIGEARSHLAQPVAC